MIGIIAASEQEIGAFLTAILVRRRYSYQCCRFYEGRLDRKEIVIALAGEGREHAGQVALLILETYQLDVLISTGFATALHEELKPHDIFVMPKIFDGDLPLDDSILAPQLSDPRLVQVALTCFSPGERPVVEGNGLTTSGPARTAENKKTLGCQYPAEIWDNAGYGIAQVASRRKVPFIGAGVILDGIDTSPPDTQEAARVLGLFLQQFVRKL